MTIFVDTWGWMALGDEKDEHFQSVSEVVWEQFNEGTRFFTSNFVLGEAITLIYTHCGGRRGERIVDKLLQTVSSRQFQLEEITQERFQKALDLRRRFRDKPKISFTDLTSMVVMRERGITDILTADRHFLKVNLGFRLVPGSSKRPKKDR